MGLTRANLIEHNTEQYRNRLISEREYIDAVMHNVGLMDAELRAREDRAALVAHNLMTMVKPMFYGGVVPTTRQMRKIAESYSSTEQWKELKGYESLFVHALMDELEL